MTGDDPEQHRSTLARPFTCTLILALVLLTACTAHRRRGPAEEIPPEVKEAWEDREVEAYLFDTEIEYEGKYSSVRLELFATDSIVGIGGRSYLGKGALDGWLTADSVRLLFPQSNEYVYEPVARLLRTFECTGERRPDIPLLAFFFARPDRVDIGPDVAMMIDSSDTDRPVFSLSMPDCPWSIELIYDRRDTGWRIREFTFDNGDNLQIEARRREYHDEVDAKARMFTVSVPIDARRIIP
ncbi:hypothetical protein GF420_03635 [candidate division GN15 bacterium]|nr:hypothetical protein [candidate division GN15 bacterium]